MMLQLRPFSLVAIVGALIGAIAPAPAAATAVDTLCYLFSPDEPNLTRSSIGLGVGGACQLHCIATLPVVLNGEITGSVDIAHEVAVDDCDTTPVLRFHPDFVRGGSPDSELRGALDRREDEAVAAVVALHELPPTDVSRARHVFGYGRGAMRTAIGARVFEIAQKAVGERTADEQRIADSYADEVKRMRVAAIECAIAE